MTYILCKKNATLEEISSRMFYIYKTFRIYTIIDNKISNKDTIILHSYPANVLDLCLIIGHDTGVIKYMDTMISLIKERSIAIISCNTGTQRIKWRAIKDKKIYVPKEKEKVDFYEGKSKGFGFEITDEEIIIYRNRKNISIEYILKSALERI